MTTQKKRKRSKHTRRIGGDPTKQAKGLDQIFRAFTSPTTPTIKSSTKIKPVSSLTLTPPIVDGFRRFVNTVSKKRNNSPKKSPKQSIINSLRRKPIKSNSKPIKTKSINKPKLSKIDEETSNQLEENMSTQSPSSTRSSSSTQSLPKKLAPTSTGSLPKNRNNFGARTNLGARFIMEKESRKRNSRGSKPHNPSTPSNKHYANTPSKNRRFQGIV